MSPLRHLRFPVSITSTCILFSTGEESVKKIVTDGKHVVRELGKSEVNFLKCTVTPSFYVIHQKQDNCEVLWNFFSEEKSSVKSYFTKRSNLLGQIMARQEQEIRI